MTRPERTVRELPTTLESEKDADAFFSFYETFKKQKISTVDILRTALRTAFRAALDYERKAR